MNQYINQLKKINSLQYYRLFYQSLISTINTKISENSIESEVQIHSILLWLHILIYC